MCLSNALVHTIIYLLVQKFWTSTLNCWREKIDKEWWGIALHLPRFKRILIKLQIGFWPRFEYLSQIQIYQGEDLKFKQIQIKLN